MRTRTGARTAVLALLCVLGVGLAFGASGSAAPAKADFALSVSPTAQSVRQSQSTAYAVTTTASGGFTGNVSLAATGEPADTTTTFTPSAPHTTMLTVATGSRTPVGSFTITITGTSGKLSHSISVRLTVNRPLPPSLALSVSPPTVTVPAGSTATYTVAINRTNFTGPVAIAVTGALPAGVFPSVHPDPTTANSTTLQLTTKSSTKDGKYTVYILGMAVADGTVKFAYAQANLVVSTPRNKPFAISGNLTGTLAPGVPPQPLDLTLANPNKQKLTIANLTVSVSGTSAGAACGPENFTVTQYNGSYPLNLAAGQTASLSQLGVSSSALPTVGMRDLPTNQDACKGVAVNLVYSGTGQGA